MHPLIYFIITYSLVGIGIILHGKSMSSVSKSKICCFLTKSILGIALIYGGVFLAFKFDFNPYATIPTEYIEHSTIAEYETSLILTDVSSRDRDFNAPLFDEPAFLIYPPYDPDSDFFLLNGWIAITGYNEGKDTITITDGISGEPFFEGDWYEFREFLMAPRYKQEPLVLKAEPTITEPENEPPIMKITAFKDTVNEGDLICVIGDEDFLKILEPSIALQMSSGTEFWLYPENVWFGKFFGGIAYEISRFIGGENYPVLPYLLEDCDVIL